MPLPFTKNLESKRNEGPYRLVVRVSLLLTVFLIPIYFLPLTSEYIEINKVFIFYVLVLIAAVFWFLDLSLSKDRGVWLGPLRTPLLVFGIIFLISSIFSYNFDTSLIGLPGYYHHSLLSIIFFIIFFFLLVNSIEGKREIKRFLAVFLLSSALAAIFSFLQTLKLYIFPWAATKSPNFNLVSNSISIFAVFLALVFLVSFILFILSGKKWLRILLFIYILFVFITLVLMGVKTGFYALIIGLVLILFFFTVKAKNISVKWSTAAALFLALSIIFLFFSVSDLFNVEIQKDIVLDQTTSFSVTKASLSKNPLFGSGPGTFYDDFTRFKPVSFNNTPYWDLNFIKAGSEWWQVLGTTGVLGFLSYLSLYVFFFIYLLKEYNQDKLEGERGFMLVLIMAGASLIFFSGIFYSFSFISMFCLILFIAFGFVLIKEGAGERELRVKKKSGAFSSLSLSLIVIFAIVVLYFSGRFLVADIYYEKANQLIAEQAELTKVENYLLKSVDLNSRQENYVLALAQNYSVMAQLAAQQANFDSNQLQRLISLALLYADKGISLSPKDPVIYLQAATLYRDINLITSDDISNIVIEAYNKAIELDPNSPLNYYNLGDYYVTQAQAGLNALETAKDEDKETLNNQITALFEQAMNSFSQAASLKKDYATAEAAIALTYELSGNGEVAISEMTKLTEKYPLDFSLFYELGRMYLNQDKLDEALANFQQVVSLFPGNSNAHWQLSVIYEKQGKKNLAIDEMEIVDQLNPDNEAVKARLEELKGEE